MDDLKLSVKNLIKQVKSRDNLSVSDKARIIEKIVWIEREIRVYSAKTPGEIPDDPISEELKEVLS